MSSLVQNGLANLSPPPDWSFLTFGALAGVTWLAGYPMRLYVSALRQLSKYFQNKRWKAGFDVEVLAIAHELSYKVVEVPIT